MVWLWMEEDSEFGLELFMGSASVRSPTLKSLQEESVGMYMKGTNQVLELQVWPFLSNVFRCITLQQCVSLANPISKLRTIKYPKNH